MRIAIGSDEAGYQLKETIKTLLDEEGYTVVDYGTVDGKPVLYPLIAEKVAVAVQKGTEERGILICGTGIGMSIVANKIPGVRAALCHDTYSAERAKLSNDAQVITMGARVIGPELAKRIVLTYLQAEGVSPSSLPKVECINDVERRHREEK